GGARRHPATAAAGSPAARRTSPSRTWPPRARSTARASLIGTAGPRAGLVRGGERRLGPLGLEQLDWVARRVLDQDLIAADADDDVAAEVRPVPPEPLDR